MTDWTITRYRGRELPARPVRRELAHDGRALARPLRSDSAQQAGREYAHERRSEYGQDWPVDTARYGSQHPKSGPQYARLDDTAYLPDHGDQYPRAGHAEFQSERGTELRRDLPFDDRYDTRDSFHDRRRDSYRDYSSDFDDQRELSDEYDDRDRGGYLPAAHQTHSRESRWDHQSRAGFEFDSRGDFSREMPPEYEQEDYRGYVRESRAQYAPVTRRELRPRGSRGMARELSGQDPTQTALAVAAAAAWSWLAFQVVMLALVGIARVFADGPSFAIVSGSMAPAVPVGSIVVDEMVDPTGLKADDIISYRDPASPDKVITHRVVSVTDGKVKTKGDANHDPDSTPLDVGAIVGKVKLVVPYVGLPSYWVKTGHYLPLGLVGGASLLAVGVIAHERRTTRARRQAEQFAEDSDDSEWWRGA